MSESENRTLYLRLLAAVGIVVLATILGLVMGTFFVPVPTVSPGVPVQISDDGSPVPPPPQEDDAYVRPDAPPLYFHSGGGTEGWRNTLAQMQLAAAAGVHQHIFSVALPWPGIPSDVEEQLQQAAETDPMGAWILEIDCHPPTAWLEANPEGMIVGEDGARVAAPVFSAWREAVTDGLDQLRKQIDREDYSERVIGVLLRGMGDGHWRFPAAGSPAVVEVEAYRAWLRGVYLDDADLQDAWKDDSATISTVVPKMIDENDPESGVLLSGNATQPIADFRRFRAESIADALASFAQHLKSKNGIEFQVWATFGYTFDMPPDAGHTALGLLLGTDVDGFVSPVSEVDRGLGGAGGFAGPVDSAGHYGKIWIVLDSGRTGITRDARTGAVERLSGLRAEDIYNVQRRNFGAALVHGLGLVWSDPEGQGWLHDEDQWRVFTAMQDVYRDATELPEGEQVGVASGAEAVATVDLMVVVDEAASRYAADSAAYMTLLRSARDAALRSGVETRFVLLQDVLDEITPPAASYLFVNTIVLDAAIRERLHKRLARESACGIWLYAPGFRADGGFATENISATVRMNVERFREETSAGSSYVLSGGWLPGDSPVGEMILYEPLFFIEDNDVDALARYRDGGKTSTATRYIEDEGWTTVYIAEPQITPGLLREILRVNEQLGYFRPTNPAFFDTAYIGDDYFVVHAKNIGERAVQLDTIYNVRDCFSETAGWPERDGFLMPMRSGETRVLRLEAVESSGLTPIVEPESEGDL